MDHMGLPLYEDIGFFLRLKVQWTQLIRMN